MKVDDLTIGLPSSRFCYFNRRERCPSTHQLSSEYVTHKRVAAASWPRFSAYSPSNVSSCSIFARKRLEVGPSDPGMIDCLQGSAVLPLAGGGLCENTPGWEGFCGTTPGSAVPTLAG